MDIHELLVKRQNLQKSLLDYIDNGTDLQNATNLISLFNDQQIGKDINELKSFLHLLSSISNNHYRSLDFFYKIEQVLSFFAEDMKSSFSNFEIFNIFIKNKRILLFLFENKIIIPDKYIANTLIQKKFVEKNYNTYFYPEIQQFIDEKLQKEYKCDLLTKDPDKFEQKRKIGENDNYICRLIQNDSINEFVIYINKTNMSLSSKIELSIFETNSYILKCRPSLIKYSAFYGSIQIFNYLISKGIELSSSLWIYALHSHNSQIIQVLKDKNIKPKDTSYKQCFKEAIRFHNSKIADKIKDDFLQSEVENDDDVFLECLKYNNYLYFPKEISKKPETLYNLCQFDYISIVDLLLKTKEVDVNSYITVISNISFILMKFY